MLKAKNKFSIKEYGSVIALLVVFLILSISSPFFLRSSNIRNIIVQVAVIAILAEGATFVILTGGIDLSVGAVLALSGVLSASIVKNTGNTFLGIFVCIAVAIICGLICGVLIAYGKVPAFVTTLGMMSIARGLSFVYTKGKPISGFSAAFRFLGTGDIFGLPVMIIVVIVLFVLMNFILKKTAFGRITCSIGSNEEATRLTGINTKKYLVRIYMLAGFLTGIASLMYVGRINSGHPNSGQGYELNAIAAVVIGGTSLSGGKGSIMGTLVGALLMGIIGNGLNLLNISSYYQNVVLGLVIILAVLADQNIKN